MIPIISTLAANGLNLLANAVMSKGKEVIEEKLGVSLDEPKTQEDVLRLKQIEIDHEEFLIDAGIKQKEQELEELKIENANTADARKMNSEIQTSENSSSLAKNAAYYIDFFIITATLLLAWTTFFQAVPLDNQQLVYLSLGSLLTMCGTILNFHRGTSHSSSKKDETIKFLSDKNK